MRTFIRTFAPAFAFIFGLTACQTLALEADPDRTKKGLLVAMTLSVDAIGVYGKLCAPLQTPACKSPKGYSDAKLIAGTLATDARLVVDGQRSAWAQIVIFGLTQAQLAKTLGDQPGPTNPDAPPNAETIAYIDSIDAADILISTASERVQEAVSVNTNLADLLADLDARVAALP